MKATLVVLAVLLAGCSKNIQTPDAVRQAVLDDIKVRAGQTGLNMAAMEVSVSALSFAQDEARATVAFNPKGMPAGSGMSMDYTLSRKGGQWAVTSRKMSSPPPGLGAPSGGGVLPPGHPSVENKQ